MSSDHAFEECVDPTEEDPPEIVGDESGGRCPAHT
jgi:hypothetical protein